MIEKQQLVEKMADFLEQPLEKLSDDAMLTDLVAQSFVLIEMVIELQEEFGVRFGQEELKGVQTVGDLTAMIEAIGKK